MYNRYIFYFVYKYIVCRSHNKTTYIINDVNIIAECLLVWKINTKLNVGSQLV